MQLKIFEREKKETIQGTQNTINTNDRKILKAQNYKINKCLF